MVDTQPIPAAPLAESGQNPWFTPGSQPVRQRSLSHPGAADGAVPIDPTNPEQLGRYLSAMRRRWGQRP
ncbi:hypothetical protein [Saccharopolyspora rosea]|uniref:hypothetical protein n=1 Tax=Saccharopolyspora rosea TaxID=524884 RepID=UPI0021D8DC8F|nr:hypothetical protein [Saccharopolyspora rosea]